MRDNIGYHLEKSHPTLATYLGRRGYATGAAVSAVVLARSTGVARGFDFYDDAIESRDVSEPLGRVQRSGGQTEKLLEEWIAGRSKSAPFLAFLHLYEPHTPYEPPEPFARRYAKSPYDGEIAAADAIVGRFLEFLKTRKLYDRSLIVFLSDHGEGLGDHGEDEHGVLLYREEIRVPLFVKLPGSRFAGHERRAAALMDVFPTVVEVIGEEVPRGLPGSSLLASGEATGSRRIYSETLYPRYHFGWSDLASLTDGRYQYIEAPRPELYDWGADPAERSNLAASLPPPFRSMRVELTALNRPLQPPGASDPETVKKLASLGYIGAAAPATDRKDLPDPKDRIGAIDRLKEASRLVSEHRDDEAVALLAALARENPLMLDAWETLARILRRAGRTREALAALERADRLSPGTPQILVGLADMHRELGDYARSRQMVEAARVAGATGVEEELASIALAEGDLAQARREAEAALAQRPAARAPLLLLGLVAQRRGDLPAALSFCDRALEIGRARGEGSIVNLQSTRGDILARQGREKEAEEALRAEIRDFPENLDAWSRLALVFVSAGRREEYSRLLSEMVERMPTSRSFETLARICEITGDRAGAQKWRQRAAEKRAAVK